MNKTNYLILTLILCFSIAFVVYPLKTFGGQDGPGEPGYDPSQDIETPITPTPDTTSIDASEVVDTSDLQNAFSQFLEQDTEPEHSNIYTDTEVIPEDVELSTGWIEGVGVWGVVVEPNESTSPTSNGTPDTTNGTPDTTNGTPDTTNGTTTNGTTDTTQPICRCVTVYSYTPCSSDSVCIGGTSSNGWTPPVNPPSPPPPPKCQIFSFSINDKTNEDQDPLFVWVNASLKGYISVNDSCTTCTVTSDDTWGNPAKTYAITSTYIDQKFKIPTSGTYSFNLKCIGNPADPDDFDEDATSLQAVQAINLPWWREIIPVLTGSLFSF